MKYAGRLAGIGAVCLVCLAPFELWLKNGARYASYYERNGLTDPGHRTPLLAEPYLQIYKPRLVGRHHTTEFSFEFSANSDGLVGPELTVAKSPGEFRVVVVGDSFTQGIGADVAHDYPTVLGRMMAARSEPPTYTVINAGIGGSDPVFGVELLQRKLLKYQPDLVILAINNSDVADLKRLGGFERYGPDGQLRQLRLPWWAWLFDRSHLVRAFVLGVLHYDWDLHSPATSQMRARQAVLDLVQCGVKATEVAAAHGFKVLVVVHPTWWDVQSGAHVPEITELLKGLTTAGVDNADLLPFFKKSIPHPVPPNYYWPKDFHYTAKGYEVFARAVYEEITSRAEPTTPAATPALFPLRLGPH